MFFSLELALAALPELGPRTRRRRCEGLLPGAVTLLLPNPARRFPLACGPDPTTLGPARARRWRRAAAALAAVRWPVLQSSANPAGGEDARRLADVPADDPRRVDLVLDAGRLRGTASTVIDLRRYEDEGAWTIVREGAVPGVEAALGGLH